MLLDTGPLVAVLDAGDQWHQACAEVWPELLDRCITIEAVVTEASHLVGRGGASASLPLRFLLSAEIPILGLEPELHRHALDLMDRYADVPMDYADAGLVAVADALRIETVFTLDRRGFGAYRPGWASKGEGFRVVPEGVGLPSKHRRG